MLYEKNVIYKPEFNSSIVIPYSEIDKKINDEVFRKYLIFDIRKLKNNELNSIFNNFDDFNYQILGDVFLKQIIDNEHFDYSKNMIALFVYSKKQKQNIDINKVLYDMKYALKKFITEDELNELLSKNTIKLNPKTKIYYSQLGFSLYNRFNLVHGLNGSGKTVLLNDFSNHFDVPIFDMSNLNLNLLEKVKDSSLIDNYFQRLTKDRYEQRINMKDYLYRLSQVMAFSKENNNMILCDNLCWGQLDNVTQINVLDALFDYLCDNSSTIVVTSCQDEVKRLVKNRIYEPNIIEVSRKK